MVSWLTSLQRLVGRQQAWRLLTLALGLSGAAALAEDDGLLVLDSSTEMATAFIGSQQGVFISATTETRLLDDLKARCAKKAAVWVTGQAKPLHCRGLQYLAEGDDGPSWQLLFDGIEALGTEPQAFVYSFEPLVQPNLDGGGWRLRQATAAERDAVQQYLSSTDVRLDDELKAADMVVRLASSEPMQVVEMQDQRLFYYPMYFTEDGGLGGEKVFYLTVKVAGDTWSLVGHVQGAITAIFMQEPSAEPLMLVDSICDGWCLSVLPLDANSQSKPLIRLASH